LQREHLHRLAIEVLQELATACEQRGALEQGVQAARRRAVQAKSGPVLSI
jgi:hypothetical protein